MREKEREREREKERERERERNLLTLNQSLTYGWLSAWSTEYLSAGSIFSICERRSREASAAIFE